MKNPEFFLHHIIDAATSINEYISGLTKDEFANDPKTQDAVVRQLEIIGEAVAQLEDNFKQLHPGIPWQDIKDFRNVLAHVYWEIDIDLVWIAATQESQELKQKLIPIIQTFS